MNKKFFKLSLLLCGITVGAHLALTVASLLVDIFSTNATLQQAFADVAQLFGSLAEITAYSIVLYSFVHFKPSEAYKSFYIAGAVHLSSVLISLIPMSILICISVQGFDAIFYYILTSFKDALFAVAYTRILPTLLIALVTYNITKKGTSLAKSVFDFRCTTIISMLISSITIYLIKVITAILTNDIIAISSTIVSGGLLTDTPKITFATFMVEMWNNVIYAHLKYLVLYLIGQYFIMFLVYCIYNANSHKFTYEYSYNAASFSKTKENNETAEFQQNASDRSYVTLTFMIIGTVLLSLSTAFVALVWCIPMTLYYYNKTKINQPLSLGFKICSLLFISFIAGILMLCEKDSEPNIQK